MQKKIWKVIFLPFIFEFFFYNLCKDFPMAYHFAVYTADVLNGVHWFLPFSRLLFSFEKLKQKVAICMLLFQQKHKDNHQVFP